MLTVIVEIAAPTLVTDKKYTPILKCIFFFKLIHSVTLNQLPIINWRKIAQNPSDRFTHVTFTQINTTTLRFI